MFAASENWEGNRLRRRRHLSFIRTDGGREKQGFGKRIMVLATFDVYNGPIPFGTSVWKPSAARYRVTNVIVVDATRAEGLRRNRRTGTTHGPFPRLRNYRNSPPRPRETRYAFRIESRESDYL